MLAFDVTAFIVLEVVANRTRCALVEFGELGGTQSGLPVILNAGDVFKINAKLRLKTIKAKEYAKKIFAGFESTLKQITG